MHSLRRGQARWVCRGVPSLRDWAVALPGFLTLCVVAYAGHHSMRGGATQTAAVPPAQSEIPVAGSSPKAEQAHLRSDLPVLMGSIGEKEPSAPVTRLADVITLTDRVVAATREAEISLSDPVEVDGSLKNLIFGDHAREVQSRLAELGYLSARPTGVWGTLSKLALRSFKEMNRLPSNDSWDEITEQALFSSTAQPAPAFVGRWASDSGSCSGGVRQSGVLQTVIESNGARAGDSFCSFKEKRQVGSTWKVAATCSDGRNRWAANIQLTVNQDVLTWLSERGTQSYVRCH